MPRIIALPIIALILASCSARSEAERDTETCLRLGYEEGTEGFRDCRLALRLEHKKARRDALNGMF